MSSVLTFSAGSWQDHPEADLQGHVWAADSFLLRNGEAVAWEHHEERFIRAVSEVAPQVAEEAEIFFRAALSRLPRTGEWFPRFDFVGGTTGSTFRLLVRPAPPRADSAILAVAEEDTRQVPHRKGPDLDRMAKLREHASHRGATEALIVAPDGTVVEGAYSSILVWDSSGSTVSMTPAHYPRIPSVTETVVLHLLGQEGFTVESRARSRDEWADCEVWVLSALHGIRLATSIIDGPDIATTCSRRQRFHQLWLNNATPLPRVD